MGAERLEFVSRSVEATEALAERLGAELTGGAIVALEGELGSGKTAFVRGLARGLGVAGGVSSPTFTLMQEHAGRLPFFHFDAWMTGREESFLAGGGDDYLGGEGVAAIEWADRIATQLVSPRLVVRLAHRTPTERVIQLALVAAEDGAGADARELERELARALAVLAGLPSTPEIVRVSAEPNEPGAGSAVGGGA